MNMAIAQQDRHILLSLWIILSLIVSDAPAMNSSRFAPAGCGRRPIPFRQWVWSRQSGRHLARTPPATPLPTRHRLLAQSRIYGHESLIRGPSDSALHFPDALFAEARRQGLHPQLELASFRAGAHGFHEARAQGLFLNLSGSALIHYWTLWGDEMPLRLLGLRARTHQHHRRADRAGSAVRAHGRVAAPSPACATTACASRWTTTAWQFQPVGRDAARSGQDRPLLLPWHRPGRPQAEHGARHPQASPSTWAPPSWPKASRRPRTWPWCASWTSATPRAGCWAPRRGADRATQPLRDSLRVRTPTPLARSAGGTAASLKVEAPAALLDKTQ